MGFHQCKKLGCGFHLPEKYPFPYCPWHLPKAAIGVVATVITAAGALGGYLLKKYMDFRDIKAQQNQREEQQKMWRENVEDRREGKRKKETQDRAEDKCSH